MPRLIWRTIFPAVINTSSCWQAYRSITIPNPAAFLAYNWEQGVVTVGGSLLQLRFDGSGATSDVSETGWAVVTGGRLYLDTAKRNFFGLGASYGEGTAQNIITFANGSVPNTAINADGSLNLTRNWNVQLALHWEWNERWSSNCNYVVARLSHV